MVYDDFDDELDNDAIEKFDSLGEYEEKLEKELTHGKEKIKKHPGKSGTTYAWDDDSQKDSRFHAFFNYLRFIISRDKYMLIAIWLVVWILLVFTIGYFMNFFKVFLSDSIGQSHGIFYYGATRKTPYIIATLSVVIYMGFQFLKPRTNKDVTRNFIYSDSDVSGSAYFMGEKEIAKHFNIVDVAKTDDQFFGYLINDNGEITDRVLTASAGKYLNGHTFICGGSGSRKTTTMLLNMALQAIKRGETIVCTDPKGELYGILKKLLESRGYDVGQFNMNDPFNSDGIDLLEELRDEDLNQMMINCQILSETIMENTSSLKANEGRGNYWYDNAEAAITGTLYYELMKDGERATFKDVYRDFQLGAEGFYALFAKLPQEHPAKKVMAPYLDTFKTGKKENCTSILSGVTSRLQILANPDILEMISNHDMDFRRAGEQKCAYFVMAPDQHKTMTFLNSTYFALMFIKLARTADKNDSPELKRQLPVRVNFLLDEFKSVGHINGFEDKLANIRSRNISLTVVMQSIAQLEVMYPGVSWEDALSNFDVNIYLGGNDSEESAGYYAKRLGEASVVTEQERHNEAIMTPLLNILKPQTMIGTSTTSRSLMSPDEIVADLPLDQALLFLKHTRAIKIGKFDYRSHPLARDIHEVNASVHIPTWVRKAKGYPLNISDEELSAIHKKIRLIWRKTGTAYSYENYVKAVSEGTLPDVSEEDPDVVNLYGFITPNGGVRTEGTDTRLQDRLKDIGREMAERKGMQADSSDQTPGNIPVYDNININQRLSVTGFVDRKNYTDKNTTNEDASISDNHKTKNGALMEKLKRKTSSLPPDDL